MKINLQNKTHWSDDHIRAFAKRAVRDERPDPCKRGAPELTVDVGYTRGWSRRSSGCACVNSNWIKVRLPKRGTPDKLDFTHVIVHELAHTRGVHHREMSRNSHYRRGGSYLTTYAWGKALPLEIKPKKNAPRPTATTKLTHARKMLKAATTREKRAITLRKKWQKKAKYYEKGAALERAG